MKTTICRLALAVSLTLQAFADSSTTNILNGVVTNVAGRFILGDTAPFNFLLITNAGGLTNTDGTIGNTAEAHSNLGIITGAGSAWSSISNLVIGATGALNQISIFDGGRAGVGWGVWLGLDAASTNNLLLIEGANSTFDNIFLHLGYAGSGNQLIVANGGRLNGNTSRDTTDAMGDTVPGTDNLLLVTGPGSWARLDNFQIGVGGSRNHLRILEGGQMINSSAALGVLAGSSENTATVLGPGSIWNCINGGLSVGSRGANNQLTLGAGAHLESVGGSVGSFATATGNVALLSGAGTLWNSKGDFNVGRSGSGNQLIVKEGATFLSSTTFIGNQSSNNMLSVEGAGIVRNDSLTLGSSSNAAGNDLRLDGPGVYWTNTGRVTLGGDSPANRILVSNGASFRFAGFGANDFSIGDTTNSRRNELIVSGPGSSLLGEWSLTLGVSGSSNLFMAADGAQVQSAQVTLGQTCASTENLALVTDPGTVWSNRGITFGYCSGGHSVIVSNGARILTTRILHSVQPRRSSSVIVTGPASLLNASSGINLGWAGAPDQLLILDGARVESRLDIIGDAGFGATALLRGSGTSWSNNSLTIGENSRSNFVGASEGARIDSGDAVIGRSWFANGNVVVLSGTPTDWNIRTNLYLGCWGNSNTLSVLDGARLSARHVYIGISNGASGAFDSIGLGNKIVIKGSNSVLSVMSNLVVGRHGRFHKMEIGGGAQVTTDSGIIGQSASSMDNHVIVADPGTKWSASGRIDVGWNSLSNSLTIRSGGVVRASEMSIGLGFFGPITNADIVTVDGGTLIVTNYAGSGRIESRSGPLRIISGRIEADHLHGGGGFANRFELFGGRTRVGRISAYTGAQVSVGDGQHNARLELTGGTYDITGDLYLRTHASISGHGGIGGFRTNNGTLGNLSGRPSALHAGVYDRLGPQATFDFVISGTNPGLTYGTISLGWNAVLNGRLRVALRNDFVPSPADVFRIITFVSATNAFLNATDGARLKTVDGRGSFLVTYSPTNITLSDYQSTDLDGDGVEDAWATNHFGHSPLTPAERLADADGDGASNYEEFKAGTDPNDPASALRLSIAYVSDRAAMSFPCVDGKEYRIWFSNNLETWMEVTDPTFAYPSPGRCEWIDDGKDTDGLGAASRFYRVTVE